MSEQRQPEKFIPKKKRKKKLKIIKISLKLSQRLSCNLTVRTGYTPWLGGYYGCPIP